MSRSGLRRPARSGALGVVLLLAVASTVGATPALAAKSKPGSKSKATTTTTTVAGCASNAGSSPAPVTPNGPTADAVVAQEASSGQPRVELVQFPRPSGPGNPWSQWGQGLVLPDGRFLSAMGNHLGKDGNAYLFSYDPTTQKVTRFADVRSLVGDDLDWGYGKVHGQIVAGPCGEAYFATYWGTRTGLAYTAKYPGDVMFRIDPTTLAVTSLGAVVPQRGIPSLAGPPDHSLVFGEAVDPTAGTEGAERGTFFALDPTTGKVVFRQDVPTHTGFRNVLVGPDDHAYVASDGGHLLEYVPGATEMRVYPKTLPGGGTLRASTAPARDGTVYGATQNPDQFFALKTDGTIESLGTPQSYTASMAVQPDGSAFYSVPGAHGEAEGIGAPLVAVDTTTGKQTTLVRLGDLVKKKLGLSTAGSYDVVLDAAHRRLYVGLNTGATSDVPWGQVVLAIVDLP